MTYKKTQESLDHIHRVASASTRPSARGIIRDIPRWAQEPEEYFNSLQEQFALKLAYFKECERRVRDLRKEKQSDPSLQSKYDLALSLMHDADNETRHLRALVHAASTNAWGTVFYLCCKLKLAPDVFKQLDDDVRGILQRDRKPIAKLSTSERDKARGRIKTLRRSLESHKEISSKRIARLQKKLRRAERVRDV